MDDAERRTHARLPREGRITCQEIAYPLGQSPEFEVRMIDVSEGGVKLAAPRPFEPGTLLQVALSLEGWQRHTSGFLRYDSEAAGKPLTAVGRVVRSLPAGGEHHVGVEFVDIWDDHWRAMRSYLEQEAGSGGAGSTEPALGDQ